MSTVRTIGILAVLGVALAMPGFAMADGTAKTQKTVAPKSAAKTSPSAKVSLSDSKEKFIYLDDGSDSDADAAAGLNRDGGFGRDAALKPGAPARSMFHFDSERAAIDAAQLGIQSQKRPILVLDPQSAPALSAGIRVDGFGATADQRTTLQIGGNGQSGNGKKSRPGHDSIGIWLTSESSRPSARFGTGTPSIDLALEPVAKRPNYNVGLNIGYQGFTIGAALLREQNGIDLAYQGYDLGFGYLGRSWFTNVQVAGFRNDSNPLYYNFMGERFRAFEVGAGYIIWPGFTFSGRFKYFDYGNPLFSGGQSEEQSVFSLDTKLNF